MSARCVRCGQPADWMDTEGPLCDKHVGNTQPVVVQKISLRWGAR